MKKQIIAVILLALSLTLSAYSQGTVQFENLDGGGLVIQDGVPYQGQFTVALYGGLLGSSFPQLTLLATFTEPANSAGFFYSGLSPYVPGVTAGGDATLAVLGWDGSYATYAAAVAAGGTEEVGGTGTFANPTGGAGHPPGPGAFLTGMPTLNMHPVPEPSTIVLGGLGAVALLLFRRRK